MLRSVGIHLTDHCNLNCIGCWHYSSLAKAFFLSLEEFEKDISRLSKLTHQLLGNINLMGGEPLLHPQFLDFVKLSRDYFPNSKIKISTNGILLAEQDDNFWKVLHDNNAYLFISSYPIDIKATLVKEKAKIQGVEVDFQIEKFDKYRQIHWHLDLEGKCDPQESFLQCHLWPVACSVLRNGKIYLCGQCAYSDVFNKYFNQNLKLTPEDYIDIHKIQSISEVLEFLASPHPFCRYCNVEKIVGAQEWQSSKREISEWI
jgi:MoaA/NifB/PqqE/SkfB family radical SAM enzyme